MQAYTLSSARQIPLCWPFPLLVPNRCSMKDSLYAPWQQETCMDLVDSFRWTIPQRNTNWGDFFFSHKLVFFPPNPEISPNNNNNNKKSKLLRDWVHSCFDFFWYVALLKRDLATRQCSEDEHRPSDSTQCQCLSRRETPAGEGREGRKEDRGNDSVTCYEIVSVFNFKSVLKF